MTTFVFIPGAGGAAAYWQYVVEELERRGHRGVAVEIRQNDPAVGLPEYAATVEAAMSEGTDSTDILVAQSMGGFTAPMVHKPVRMIVLVNAMVPLPGEQVGDWWDATGSEAARRAAEEAAGRDPEFEVDRHFFHDLTDEAKQLILTQPEGGPSDKAWTDPCSFDRWPDVPIKVLVGRDDRFFPADFQRRVAKERLGLDVDEIPGGHLVAMSNPAGLADKLVEYAAELG